MGPEEQPTKVEKAQPNTTRVQQHFMKLLEDQNKERVRRLQRIRKNNLYIGSGLGAAVLGIYFYTMFAVKQEKFLDDFEEPEKVTQ